MCKKIFNWLKKLFGQVSSITPEDQKQNVQTNTPSSTEGKNAAPTEVKSSADAVSVSVEDKILKKVDMIERYLKLEKIALETKCINFSFVKDDNTKNRLLADHIEMWRCRYGLSRHQQDFRQFCLQVNMQVETLLRYWCNQKYPNEAKAIAEVREKWPGYNPKNSSLDVKGMLILFYPKQSNDKDLFEAIRVIRNNSVHPYANSKISEDDDSKAKRFFEQNDIYLHYFCGIPTAVDDKMKTKEEFWGIIEIEKNIEQKSKDIEEYKKENSENINAVKEDIEKLKRQKRVHESNAEKRLNLWKEEIDIKIPDYNNFLRIQCLLTNTPYEHILKALKKMSEDIANVK